ncbi:MAG: restriction endonuclease [Polyangiaceae bacterium]|nr:restriction endonuclease [Polyangiaceae bacterium]
MNALVNVHLEEWEQRVIGVAPDDPLAGIDISSAADRALIETLSSTGMLEVRELRKGIEITTNSFVGKIRFDAFSAAITPKLGQESFVRLFRYAYGLRDLSLMPTAPFSAGGSLFEDLLPAQLLAEAEELLARGLDRRYVAVEEPLSSPRGRIDMNRIAREGGIVRGSLPCRHHMRLSDCLLNQVLVGGLLLAAGCAQSSPLKIALRKLADVLAVSIRPRPLHRHLVAQAVRNLDRMAAAYAPALTIILLLLDGESPALDDSEQPIRLPGFLLDMNRFFQRLLGRFLRENLEDAQVVEEESLKDLLRYAPGQNPRNRRAPRPRPDFAIKTAEGKRLLFDAKYRDLWARSLPREMLYQLAMYALSQPRGAVATILYPTMVDEARPARIEISEPLSGWDRASIVLQPVHLTELDRAIAGDRATARERQELARRMFFPMGGDSAIR